MACDAPESRSPLTLTEGWVRAMPPGSAVMSAYGTFSNQGTESLKIVSASSDSFSSVGFHETRVEADVSRMERQSGWTLEPGKVLELRPGGKHLMLMQPTRELAVGSEITLILVDDAGTNFEFRLRVEAR